MRYFCGTDDRFLSSVFLGLRRSDRPHKTMARPTVLLVASLAVAAAQTPPPFGLSDDAVPRHYSVELTVDPDRDAFDGVVKIDIDLRKRMPTIWLNAAGLAVSETDLQVNGHFAPIRATVHDGEVLGIEMETPAGPGRALLTLRYKAPLADKAIIGPYRLLFEDHWYRSEER